jgi:serine phosphatase RsbU (regulator of sigma subunit)
VLSPGARLTVGSHHFLYERRGKRELEAAEALERELQRANQYVLATLPLPLREGPVLAEWYYLPSTSLGGDAFGYRDLGGGVLAGYILDVAGHGVDAALHSISVANLLRHDGLLGVDLRDPPEVMQRLNANFQMEDSGGLFFTCWYWVYDSATRRMEYCSAGHHASYLLAADRRTPVPLLSRNPAVGLLGDITFRSETAVIPPGAALYLFSDGVYEIEDNAGQRWTLDSFLPKLTLPAVEGMTEPQRLYEIVRDASRPGPLEDDFSLVTLVFP